MARPFKSGVCFFPKDVDFYEDEKVRYIRGRFGAKGMYLLDFLLCQIYGTSGYYLEWNERQKSLLSADADCGCTPGFLQELVDACLNVGLFDENCVNVCGILTSAGIQRRYVRLAASRDAVYLVNEYLLLDKSSKKDFPDGILEKVVFFDGNPPIFAKNTGVFFKKTGVFVKGKSKETKNKEKEKPPKEKENKRKEIIYVSRGCACAHTRDGEPEEGFFAERRRMFERFWNAYPKKVQMKEAYDAFVSLFPEQNEELFDRILKDVTRRAKSLQWQKEDGMFVPHPWRYLRRRVWDEPITDFPYQTGNDTAKPKKPKKRQNKAPGGVSQKDKEVELLAWDIIANELETEDDSL